MRIFLFLFIIIFALDSCKQNNNEAAKVSLRDTVAKDYFQMIAAADRYDTSDFHFKVLKAYANNDTAALHNLDSVIRDKKINRPYWELWREDIPLSPLKDLGVKEAYRFIFSIYGAPAYEAITIFEKDSAYRLNYVFYTHPRDTSKFSIRRKFDKDITQNQWKQVVEKLRPADFWGLTTDDNGRGDDGNDLTVISYKNYGVEQTHPVQRWTFTTLNDAFYYVYYDILKKGERQFGK